MSNFEFYSSKIEVEFFTHQIQHSQYRPGVKKNYLKIEKNQDMYMHENVPVCKGSHRQHNVKETIRRGCRHPPMLEECKECIARSSETNFQVWVRNKIYKIRQWRAQSTETNIQESDNSPLDIVAFCCCFNSTQTFL